MERMLTISELAERAGVTRSHVNNYELVGLIRPAGRKERNQRLYALEDVERLRLIQAAYEAGFELEAIKSVVRYKFDGLGKADGVRLVVRERLAYLKRRMESLQFLYEVLESLE